MSLLYLIMDVDHQKEEEYNFKIQLKEYIMANYNGPVCKLCRREKSKLYLKGDRCYTTKCSFDRKSYAPGEQGQKK